MKIKKQNVILIIRIVAVVFMSIFFIKSCLMPNLKFFNEKTISEKEEIRKQTMAQKEYLSLFKDTTAKNMRLHENYIIKSNHPFACYFLYNDYQIIVHKVGLLKMDSLRAIVDLRKEEEIKSTSGSIYAGYELDNVHFNYTSDNDSVAKNIIIAFDGALKNRKEYSDSIVNFNLQATNLSIRYEENGIADMFFSKDKSSWDDRKSSDLSINITIYKKEKYIYIIVLYPRDNGVELSDDFLPNILR